MSNITALSIKSIRQQAEDEVRKESADRALSKMKAKLRERAGAEAILKAIDLQIVDLEQQIADGTL